MAHRGIQCRRCAVVCCGSCVALCNSCSCQCAVGGSREMLTEQRLCQFDFGKVTWMPWSARNESLDRLNCTSSRISSSALLIALTWRRGQTNKRSGISFRAKRSLYRDRNCIELASTSAVFCRLLQPFAHVPFTLTSERSKNARASVGQHSNDDDFDVQDLDKAQ